ncbi:dihydrolipoamide acetyltransferase component of pyruvate dehydrogenase complex [Thermogemmatispora aurantia]|uniref:dihydrolipoamide acetyltransferase family protein n=1 Tax=Thermogemmatispora aurantia TaxID=2045279 RepID=UPI00124F2E20|nr:dihydrolipoamide acetyltransferase family protein [Thermogemmatispora aurantia]GER84068.1 dihydrolipoamide acetyltransferase component of pyruvate dehydrogenase complex [Thermogemmatispora aurantia]
MVEFRLPDLGEGMEEAEIRRWLVRVGERVTAYQAIAEVETDKAVTEITSPVTGRVAEIRVGEGTRARKGEVLVVFEEEAAASAGERAQSSPVTAATAVTTEATGASRGSTAQAGAGVATAVAPAAGAGAASGGRRRVLAAPAVRKLAFELGVDLEQVPPSTPEGRVTLADVRAFAERQRTAATESRPEPAQPVAVAATANGAQPQPGAAPAPEEERQALTGLRRRIAERMERSWRSIPHATAFDEADGGALVALREALLPVAERRGLRLTYLPLLVKLLIPVLKEFPIFNASLDEERREIVYKRVYHIGIATASPEGLLVPVLRHADRLSLAQIASELERLIEGGRRRSLGLHELTGSTFTLNNVGSFGGSSGTPIINYPEAAILAVGRLQEKAVVRNGSLVARPVLPLALSFDHRLIDGAQAGAFLARFKELVENPQQLLLDVV